MNEMNSTDSNVSLLTILKSPTGVAVPFPSIRPSHKTHKLDFTE
jgi:hypothetical protein